MPRPTLPPSTRKTRTVSFRLTEPDFLRLAQKAADANTAPNDLARLLMLSRLEKLVIKVHKRHDPVLIQHLSRIGNNLNQLVKNAHIFGRISPRIEALCRRIEVLVDEAIDEGGAP